MTYNEIVAELGCAMKTISKALTYTDQELLDRSRKAQEATGRRDWSVIIGAESYDTDVTLRQLFYQLVARQIIRNTDSDYTYLSQRTAIGRREGTFPTLIDQRSEIHVPSTFSSPESAMAHLRRVYRRDHTEGQEVSIYLGVEKAGIVNQLWSWFADLGIPIIAPGGHCSQSYADEIVEHVEDQDRPAVLIYAGDHDASGEDIFRDLVGRTDCWESTHCIALTGEQVTEYDLPINTGKTDDAGDPSDTRAAGFMERHGYDTNVQVEMDALDPNVLHELYQDAVDEQWDSEAYDEVIEREKTEREKLKLPGQK
jgi:hypothetical protein